MNNEENVICLGTLSSFVCWQSKPFKTVFGQFILNCMVQKNLIKLFVKTMKYFLPLCCLIKVLLGGGVKLAQQ